MSRLARERTTVAVVCCVLTVAVLGPALGAGFVLTYDMVFVPRQDLLPWMLGLSEEAPRSVPQDAWVALLTRVVDGGLLQKICLVAVVAVAASGVMTLLRTESLGVRALAALMTVWTPFVAERLVLGSWSLLLAYALLPWVVIRATVVRAEDRGRASLVLLVAAGSITPTGGVLLAVAAVAILLWPRVSRHRAYDVCTVAALLAVQLPWVLPAVLGSVTGGDESGVRAFALNAEGPWGAVITALGTGGVWSSDVVPDSRGLVTAPVITLLLVGLAVVGARGTVRVLGRPAATVLLALSVVGFVVAVSSAVAVLRPGLEWVVLEVPGGGLLRDAQKWLLPYTLLLAVAAALGASQLVRRVAAADARGPLLVAAGLLPLLAVPDLVWGVTGRLSPSEYPDDWARVRTVLEADARDGDVVSLPWSSFRAYGWNDDRTVLDPAPRYLPRTVVTDDRLPVTVGDSLVVVEGEGGRSAVVESALRTNRPLEEVAPALGIRWVLVQADQPTPVPPRALDGAREVLRGPDLALFELDGEVEATQLPAWAPWVVAADVGALAVLLVALASVTRDGIRRRGARRHLDDPPFDGAPRPEAPATLDQPEKEVG